MFEFLVRKNRRMESVVSETELHNQVQVTPDSDNMGHGIHNFIMDNAFNGDNLRQYSIKCLSQFAREKEISQGAFYISDVSDGKPVIKFLSGFASPDPEKMNEVFNIGEGFPGQVAKDGSIMNISDIPQDYLTIESGLGRAVPASLILFPVKKDDKVLAVFELASFKKFTEADEKYFGEVAPVIAENILKCKSN